MADKNVDDKLYKLLSSLDYDELLKVKNDLDYGSFLMKNVVGKKLFDIQHTHKHLCASCGKKLNCDVDDAYTLLFGERTIRKKASFCGFDCLSEFMVYIKEQRELNLKCDSN